MLEAVAFKDNPQILFNPNTQMMSGFVDMVSLE